MSTNIASWPSSLPNPEYGMGAKRQNNRRSFKPDVGTPKSRRRSTAIGTMYNCACLFTSEQLAEFNEFHDETLSDGNLSFEMDEPRTGVTYTWRFDPDDTPEEEEVGPSFTRVRFKLIRLP